MSYFFGPDSRAVLDTVHPHLRAVMYAALALSPVDVTAFEGVRTIEKQRENVAKGVSQTMDSKHLPRANGLADAVDMVPYVRGKLLWNEAACDAFSSAVRDAAIRLGVPITWGGAWGQVLNDAPSAAAAKWAYYDRKLRLGQRPFYDGAHFELAAV